MVATVEEAVGNYRRLLCKELPRLRQAEHALVAGQRSWEVALEMERGLEEARKRLQVAADVLGLTEAEVNEIMEEAMKEVQGLGRG